MGAETKTYVETQIQNNVDIQTDIKFQSKRIQIFRKKCGGSKKGKRF